MNRILLRALAALAVSYAFACTPSKSSPAKPTPVVSSGGETNGNTPSQPKFGDITVRDSSSVVQTMRTITVGGGQVPLHATVDSAGDQLNVVAEDAAHASGDTGSIAMARVDASAGSSATAGDYATLNVDTSGNLRTAISGALAAGSNNIGDVDVASIAAGDNNVGNVDVVTLPALPAGTNNIGDVDVLTLPALAAGTNNIGDIDVLTLPALPAGSNNIGDVDVLSVVPGTSATSLGKAEDAAHTTGDTAVPILARVDASSGSTATAGDYGTINVDTSGNLRVAVSGAITLPSGAATESTLADVLSTLQTIDSESPPVGQATMGASMPVTIASNQSALAVSGSISVSSIAAGGNNIGDVDVASIAAGTNNIGDVDIASAIPAGNNNIGDVDVASLPALAAGSANIGDVDVLTVITGTGATNLGKAEDAAHTTADTGVSILARVDDSAGSSATAGDYATLNVNTAGELRVATTVSSAAISSIAAGNNNIGDVDVASVIPGTGATNLGKAEDAVHASGDTGVLIMGVRRDTAATSATTDGDNATLNLNASGRLYTSSTIDAALPAGTNNIGDVDLASAIPAGSNNIGDVDVASSVLPTGAATETTLGLLQADVDGLALAEDSALASGALGTQMLARVDDSGASSVTAGDAATLNVTSGGNLRVSLASGATIGLAAGANTIGTVTVGTLPALPSGTNNIGDIDVLTMPALAAGNNNVGDVDVATIAAGNNNIGDVDVASIIAGTTATALGKAEDAAHTTADTGVMSLARVDDAAGSTGTSGDYGTFNVTSTGELRVDPTLLTKTEDAAHATGDRGIQMLGRVDASAGSTSSTGDYGTLNLATTGELRVVAPHTKIEDAAHVSGDSGVMAFARVDNSAGSTSTAGDNATLNVTTAGDLRIISGATSIGGYSEATVMSTLATNVDQTGNTFDTRGYSSVIVIWSMASAGTTATGFFGVCGGTSTSTPCTNGGDMQMDNPIGDSSSMVCSVSEAQKPLSVTFTAGTTAGVCMVRIDNPPPFIAPYWTRSTGGTATGANGITTVVYGSM